MFEKQRLRVDGTVSPELRNPLRAAETSATRESVKSVMNPAPLSARPDPDPETGRCGNQPPHKPQPLFQTCRHRFRQTLYALPELLTGFQTSRKTHTFLLWGEILWMFGHSGNGRRASCFRGKSPLGEACFFARKGKAKSVQPFNRAALTSPSETFGPFTNRKAAQLSLTAAACTPVTSGTGGMDGVVEGGGLWATSSNQRSVTLEQLLLWVNNSRSRTFLAFIVELSIFKLAKRAGGNFTRRPWPILDSFY